MSARAGCRSVQVGDAERGLSFPLLLLYPTDAAEAPLAFGPYEIAAAADAAPLPGQYPLLLLSHGGGGTPLAYRELALFLARSGYIVALPEHAGNNRHDNALENSDENLLRRPRHLQLSIDAVLADAHLAPHVRPGGVGVIGHSMGGYSALALAGGTPYNRAGRPLATAGDPRVAALVLLAPAAAWFMAPGALRRVDLPILLLSAEHDQLTPPWQGELVRSGVARPELVDSETIANAGHHSFLCPFPPAMLRPGFVPAQDPPGFDRPRFQLQLQARLAAFLAARLARAQANN
ncbi:alpha/beta hydrolase [Janthinobacterium sp. BJB412]|nr:alpha/beta hydrolase [Janthinobacterium sp. BJB412]